MLKRDVLSQSFRFTHDMLIQNVYKCIKALKWSQQRASDYMESIVVVVGYRI